MLVGLPGDSLLGGSSTLYDWWNEGAGGAYATRSASEPTIEGHGYWAWFLCPRAVTLASGSDHLQVPLGRYRASMIANPSGTHATILTGHDFAAAWDPAQNGGTGGYRLSGYREPQEIPIGAGTWVFSYRNTTVSLARP